MKFGNISVFPEGLPVFQLMAFQERLPSTERPPESFLSGKSQTPGFHDLCDYCSLIQYRQHSPSMVCIAMYFPDCPAGWPGVWPLPMSHKEYSNSRFGIERPASLQNKLCLLF